MSSKFPDEPRPSALEHAGAGHGRRAAHHDALAIGRVGRRVMHQHLVAGLDNEVAVDLDMSMQASRRVLDFHRAGKLEPLASQGA